MRPERMLCKPDYNLDRVSGLHPSVHKPDMSVAGQKKSHHPFGDTGMAPDW
jgi:hypothetical protein